ncbi:hypothetical protein AA309_28670 [Microvirga vignae]|uniref:Protein kinase domain-containing protein n=2 Tax=Microvirga vignae TaxID=1225564 RepID=A0A0H1RBG3_9HYPH|nr:hypothetical protein AA309_28670 [Microvirga vignae]
MSLVEPLVLAPDLIFVPVSECAPDLLAQIPHANGDYILTRPRSRSTSKVVNFRTAGLLAMFRKPRTLAHAAFELSLAAGTDAEQALEEIIVVLNPFIQAQWLGPAASAASQAITPTMMVGESWDSHRTVAECVHLLEDSEVYRLVHSNGTSAALKLVPPRSPPSRELMLDREAEILRSVAGAEAPALIDTGRYHECMYIIMDWCEGTPVPTIAKNFRAASDNGFRNLSELSARILRTYSSLHDKEILHGDVNTRNVIIEPAGGVKIIDFGNSCRLGDKDAGFTVRGAVPEFYDPELATAILRGKPPGKPTSKSEQYALAALVYMLLTGATYLRFSPDKKAMLEQILRLDPLPFDAHGISSMPRLEAVLGKALAKDPEQRFQSVHEFATALETAELPGAKLVPSIYIQGALDEPKRLLQKLADHGTFDRGLLQSAPSCSLYYGAAGIAYTLNAIACALGDPELLNMAVSWASGAITRMNDEDAFLSRELDIRDPRVERESFYFGRPGVFAVRALTAHTQGDHVALAQALTDFSNSPGLFGTQNDLALGYAGILVCCSLLYDTISGTAVQAENHPLAYAARLASEAKTRLDVELDRRQMNPGDYLGIAHGWAGVLYSRLLWSEVSAIPIHAATEDWLELLCRSAREHGRGVRWPIRVAFERSQNRGISDSWCNGSAGYVSLWTLAYRLVGNASYLEMAERAAWAAWKSEEPIGSLCCGYLGRAYALLNVYRNTGQTAWLERAKILYTKAAHSKDLSRLRFSLFRGEVALALLAYDLDSPDSSSFPLFERDTRDWGRL